MLNSMTGFGKSSSSFANKKITVEIKSLNSKQIDLTIKLPTLYREKEMVLRSMVSESLGRGKVDLFIFVESPDGDRKTSINTGLALRYIQDIKKLTEQAGIADDSVFYSALLSLPDVLQSEKLELDENEWTVVEGCVNEAIDGLLEFRENEGARLASDIVNRIHIIEELRKEVDGHLPERIKLVRQRIEKNVKDFISSEETDKNRLEQEIIYYLEKLDITEEHIRLAGHCKYFLETIEEPGDTGKKLGFITQEIGREINTMGSKANYVPIQKLVVRMKDELEKIKEQLLNIN